MPFALTPDGELADPGRPLPGGPYRCLQCDEPVSFRTAHTRAGRPVIAHFAHRSGSECSGESVVHLAAKMRLVQALSEPGAEFGLLRVCQRHRCQEAMLELWSPPVFDEVREEVTIGEYRLDVALLHEGSVVFGFEVFFAHRVGRVKAAQLSAPWLELDAAATAANPHVLTPVVDDDITGDDEESLRSCMRATRAQLVDKLTWRLGQPAPLSVPLEGAFVPERLVTRVLHARREGGSSLTPWSCEACMDAQRRWAAHLAAEAQAQARLEAERRERAVLERERRTHSLAVQRQQFGPDLLAPFEGYVYEHLLQFESTYRFARRYAQAVPGLHDWLREYAWEGPDFVARRCLACQRPMLCVDTRRYLPEYQRLAPMLEYFRPQGGAPGYLLSRCLSCGARQPLRRMRESPFVEVVSHFLFAYLERFPRASPAKDSGDLGRQR